MSNTNTAIVSDRALRLVLTRELMLLDVKHEDALTLAQRVITAANPLTGRTLRLAVTKESMLLGVKRSDAIALAQRCCTFLFLT